MELKSEQIDIITDAFNYINESPVDKIIVIKKNKKGYCHSKIFGTMDFLEIVGLLQVSLTDYQMTFHERHHLEEFHDVRYKDNEI
jgi:hypothetical protein